MAHECPECYCQCHCGGDIDDLLLNEDMFVNRCSHCPVDGVSGSDLDYPAEDEA